MSVFDDVSKKVQDTASQLDGVNLDELKEKASGAAHDVLDKAQELKDKIPGDVDDKIIDKAEEIKDKFVQ